MVRERLGQNARYTNFVSLCSKFGNTSPPGFPRKKCAHNGGPLRVFALGPNGVSVRPCLRINLKISIFCLRCVLRKYTNFHNKTMRHGWFTWLLVWSSWKHNSPFKPTVKPETSCEELSANIALPMKKIEKSSVCVTEKKIPVGHLMSVFWFFWFFFFFLFLTNFFNDTVNCTIQSAWEILS